MLSHSVPPSYQRRQPPVRPKPDPFTGIIDRILEEDHSRLSKQRHTAKRICERLKQEHRFAGSYAIVKHYVREQHQRSQEMFVPLAHPPRHAHVDFGEALAVIAGQERKVHFLGIM